MVSTNDIHSVSRPIAIIHDTTMKSISEAKLYSILFKAELQEYGTDFTDLSYKVGNTIYNPEYEVILSYLHKITSIVVYADGTVRLMLDNSLTTKKVVSSNNLIEENRTSIFLTKVKTLISTLKNI